MLINLHFQYVSLIISFVGWLPFERCTWVINDFEKKMLSFRWLQRKLGSLKLSERYWAAHRTAFSPKYLLFTNIGISVSLSAIGDILEQQYEIYSKDIEKYKPKRTAQMALSGTTVGVVTHYWYKYLDRRLPGKAFSTVIKKVVIDQLVCSPITIATFFVTLGLLENSTKQQILQEIKSKAVRLYAAEWVVWPPAQIINFLWLPTKYRVLYDNTISLGYDIYTSRVKYGN